MTKCSPTPPPQKKNPANTLIILYIIYKKGETPQGEYVTGPKPLGVRIPQRFRTK